MSKDKTLIFVLGMHRSGTSAVTRMLNILGAELGDDLLEAQQGVNEKGFWEHRELVQINEELLSAMGSSWYDFRSLPHDWWLPPAHKSIRQRARHFLDTAFAGQQLCVMKDPRLCVLLPFWLHVAKKQGWRSVAVTVTRAPWEVAASLCKRDPLDESTANLLWLRYSREADRFSREIPRFLVDYAAVLGDRSGLTDKMARVLGIHWPVDPEIAEAAILREIDPSLRHQESRFSNSNIQISSLAARVYHRLIAPGGKDSDDSLDKLWEEFDGILEQCGLLSDAAVAANSRLVDINGHLHKLGLEHEAALRVISERDALIGELNSELKTLGTEHEHAQGVVKERDDQLAQLNTKHAELGKEHEHALIIIAQRDGQLEQINQELAELGKEHRHALDVVSQRDEQLEKLNSDYAHAQSVVEERDQQLRELNARHQELLQHPAVKVARKVFSLDK